MDKVRVFAVKSESPNLTDALEPIIRDMWGDVPALKFLSTITNHSFYRNQSVKANKRLLTILYKYLKALDYANEWEDYVTDVATRAQELCKTNPLYFAPLEELRKTIEAQERSPWCENDTNCQIYEVVAYHKDLPYGSVMVYFNPTVKCNDKPFIFFRHMTLFPLPYLVRTLFPEIVLPNLNALIHEQLPMVGRNIGAQLIVGQTTKEQCLILRDLHGYSVSFDHIAMPGSSIEVDGQTPFSTKLIE